MANILVRFLAVYIQITSYIAECDEESETRMKYLQKAIEVLERSHRVESFAELQQRIGPFKEPFEFVKHSNDEIIKILNRLHTKYPYLTNVYQIGKSVEGRPLTVIAIGRNPRMHVRGIPEFRYVANMHGNEISGREMLLSLAEVLLVNYGKNAFLTRLVNKTRIHLLPTMNPDGFERAIPPNDAIGWNQGRSNAASVDLNHDFPQRLLTNDRHKVQPETEAVIKWSRSIPFVLSASLHDGSSVVSFPYDDDDDKEEGEVSPTPDHELFIYLSYSYARAHKTMWIEGPRCDNRDDYLQQGITNGFEWYNATGGMQDWNYVNTNCFEVTVELSCNKHLSSEELRQTWEENKFALISYIEKIHQTINGVITDRGTGAGIAGVRISINSAAKVITSGRDGDYWRPIIPGTYNVTFRHRQYVPYSQVITVTGEHPFETMNVTMIQRKGK